jgi:DNA-binding Lrp family transcriptional regulator
MQVWNDLLLNDTDAGDVLVSPSFVRRDLKKSFKNGIFARNKFYRGYYINNKYDAHNIIDVIIDRNIINNINYGTWLTYQIDGLEYEIKYKIIDEIDKCISANILKNHFIDYVYHLLYKPGGPMCRKLIIKYKDKML